MRKTFSLLIAVAVAGCAARGPETPSPDKAALAESRYKMGVAYLNTATDYKAYQELKSALELAPGNDKYLYTMGLFFMKKERYSEAEPFLKSALEKKPEDSEYMNAYAAVLAGTGRLNEAVDYWDRVISDPGYPYQIMALYNAAGALYDAGRYSRVPSYLDRALNINRRYADAYRLLFNTYIKLGDKAKAEKTMLRTAEMIPDDPENHLTAAEFYFDSRQYSKAVPFLEHLLEAFPDTPQASRAGELMKRLGLMNE
ncbi:MAG: tetratricopeptide repeat protein [Deferribacterales bacterium]